MIPCSHPLLLLLLCFTQQQGGAEVRKVPVPPHRFSPLKTHWMDLYTPVVEHLKLQIRMNLQTRNVEIKVHFKLSSSTHSFLIYALILMVSF